MFYSIVLFVFALLSMMALSARGPSVQKPTRLSEGDAGRTVELHAGDKLEVSLKGNPTTGYQWEMAVVDAAVLKLVGEPEFNPDSSALGAGGKVTLRFEAVAAGQTILQLIYHRSFEKNVPPIKTFKATVVIK
jgi:inhibitor of cysteine peptidase